MPISVPRSLPRSSRLLATIGALAMVSTGELDPTFLLVFLSLFLFGIKIESFPKLSRLMGRLQPYFAGGFFILGIFDFLILSNSFLLSIAHFLLCLQGLRLLSIQTARENLGSILLSSLMILSASTLAVEWTFFVMLFLFLPAVIWTLVLHNLVFENQKAQESENEIQKNLFSEEELQKIGHYREKSISWKKMLPSVRSVAFFAFVVSVLTCVFVFTLFPRVSLQGFRGRFLQPVNKSGFTKEVNLQTSGQIYTDNSIVMRIEISPEDREKWPGYIRGSILDRFDGKTWKRSSLETQRIYNNGRGEIHIPSEIGFFGDVLKQDIYLESMESSHLFSVTRPSIIKIDRPFLVMRKDETILRPFGDAWRIHYEVQSFVSSPFEKDFQRSYLKRPQPHFIGPWEKQYAVVNPPMPDVQRVSLGLVKGAKTPLQSATRISNYLSQNYSYTLNLGLQKRDQPLETFLFESKKGHCEYFASAMCIMLRSVGIPARLITGFYSEEWNERGHYVVVRSRHAHSWVEAFIEPYGWMEFDPSPMVWPGQVDQPGWLQRLAEAKDYLNLSWNRYILSYDLERQIQIVKSVNKRSRNVSHRLDRWFRSIKGIANWYSLRLSGIKDRHLDPTTKSIGLTTLFVAIGLIFLGTLALIFWPKKKKSVVWFYEPLLKFLEKKGGEKPSSKTLGEFTLSLKGKLGNNFDSAFYLCQQYNRARFGSAAISEKEKASIKETIRSLK